MPDKQPPLAAEIDRLRAENKRLREHVTVLEGALKHAQDKRKF